MISSAQYLQMQQRLAPKVREAHLNDPAAECESTLHKEILDWAGSQWPRWICVRARMDQKSTLPEGCHDITVFGPYPVCVLVECKARNEKLKPRQREWAVMLKALGWEVHVVRSFEQFILLASLEVEKWKKAHLADTQQKIDVA